MRGAEPAPTRDATQRARAEPQAFGELAPGPHLLCGACLFRATSPHPSQRRAFFSRVGLPIRELPRLLVGFRCFVSARQALGPHAR